MAEYNGRAGAWLIATTELARVGKDLDLAQYDTFAQHFDTLNSEHRLFFSGQGRSGLAAQMVAMRFMHMGLPAHFVGEATAPSVRDGDTLVLVSGSGKTPVSLNFAEVAKSEGAKVLLVTHQDSSPLREVADAALVLPVAGSTQFGGTLFEESALIVLDSIVLDQMHRRGVPAETMAYNHTNFL
ncbi:SIS domain-containing protein [Georgenia subflava]|uniref:SIS domain-containing protein n=1 Tax=Georgenia subflava TaxID=1622177 RepID=UPI00128DC055|nr:SIS domain-containing protein [Georgenia subflava]